MGLQVAALPTAANIVAVTTLLVLLTWTPVVIDAVREYKIHLVFFQYQYIRIFYSRYCIILLKNIHIYTELLNYCKHI